MYHTSTIRTRGVRQIWLPGVSSTSYVSVYRIDPNCLNFDKDLQEDAKEFYVKSDYKGKDSNVTCEFYRKASVIRDLCVRRVLPPEIYVTHENLKISLILHIRRQI